MQSWLSLLVFVPEMSVKFKFVNLEQELLEEHSEHALVSMLDI